MATLTLWQQSEIVREKAFPMWFAKKYNVFSDFVEKGEVQVIGERDYRIPFQTTPGGRFGHYDPQMGDMGRGSMPTGNVMLQSFFSARQNYEFDGLTIKATSNKNVSKENPFMKCIATGVREMEFLWDKCLHKNGTAALANAVSHSSATGFSVYTMDNLFGTQLLRRGQFYTVYDSTLTTIKSAGVLWAMDIGTQARTLKLSGIVPNAANTDVICFEGVSGPTPAGPRGLQYWISAATSGVTAGINRANENQIIAKSVDGTNGLTTEAVMALYHRILMDRAQVADGLIGLCAPAQQAYAYTQMLAIQTGPIDGEKARVIDRLPQLKGKKFFMWGGVPHYVDIHQDQTTVPYIIPGDFGKARLAPRGFYETPGKSGESARFINPFAASGGPANGVWFGLTLDEDMYNINPGEQGLIFNLPLGGFYQ